MYRGRYNFEYNSKGRTDSRSLRRRARAKNNILWEDNFIRDVSLLISLFEWENMPDTIDQTYFEQVLLFEGQACIVYDEEFKAYVCGSSIPAGPMNMYYQNGIYRCVGLGYSKQFMALNKWNRTIFRDLMNGTNPIDIEYPYMEGVVCKDNSMEYPLINTVEIYTNRITDAMRTIDVVQFQAKFPGIFETDEDTKRSIEQVVQDIDENVIAVYATKKLSKSITETKKFDTGFNPAVLDVLWNNKNNLMSEKLTAYGINNLNTSDKKERLITDEVKSNNQYLFMNLAYRLKQRQIFCENMNSVFGLNMSVNISEDYSNIIRQIGGETDGSDITDTGRASGDT